ncbi:MAG: glycosyltransferase family 39 protein [Gemmataceae bacterium]
MPLRQSSLARWIPEPLCPYLAFLLIAAFSAFHLVYLAQGCDLDLAPDEAHYWDWSRHLDWSYYSKGPLVAWLIRASCELFGPWSEMHTGSLTLAVRIPAVFCGGLLLVSLFLLARDVFQSGRLALALVVCAMTLPLITAGSLLMTIDSPYTCCWGWASYLAYRAITRDSLWAWMASGLVVGIGILAKYTMVLFPASLALFLFFSSRRGQLLSRGFILMSVIALLCCAPILIWNAQHDWVTFLHVRRLAGVAAAGERSLRSGGGIRWLGPLVYLGGQAGLLLGYWFAVWLGAMIAWNPLRRQEEGIRFLWWLSAPVFLLFFAFSIKTGGGEPNWPVTAYLTGGILAAAWLVEHLQSPRPVYRATCRVCLGLAIVASLTITSVLHRTQAIHPIMESVVGSSTGNRPFPLRQIDPTCRLRGWRHLASEVDTLRQQLLREEGVEPVLAGVSWALPGELGVYCSGHPQAYNIGLVQGDRHSQYDFWTNPVDHPETFMERTFLIVGPIAPSVEKGFRKVDPAIHVMYRENGRPISGWTLHICRGFKGFGPMDDAAPH